MDLVLQIPFKRLPLLYWHGLLGTVAIYNRNMQLKRFVLISFKSITDILCRII